MMMTTDTPIRWVAVAGGLGTFALTLFLLDWLEPVLVPLVLALLFSFILAGSVQRLERAGVRPLFGATTLAIAVVALVVGLGWVVVKQAEAIVSDLPSYEWRIVERVRGLTADHDGLVDRLRGLARRLEPALAAPPEPAGGRGTVLSDTVATPPAPPLRVEVVGDSSNSTVSLTMSVLQTALVPIATGGLALILTIFMLVQREELRDRLIAVLSRRRLTLTTRALDDIGHRIARHLALQFGLNCGFGLLFWLGMVWIGVPYAALWGVLAALLRYVPLIGPWVALAFPLAMSLLLLDGWLAPSLLIGWFVFIEVLFGAVLEPNVFGRGVGISPTATLVAIAFWSWLWGPIGLLLATPLTACVVVIAQYVPQLGFVATLLGDRPGLPPPMRLYQRLLARDVSEASGIVTSAVAAEGFIGAVDRTLVPAMTLARHEDAALLPDESDAIWRGFDAVVAKLPPLAETVVPATDRPRLRLIALAASGEENDVAVRLLRMHLGDDQVEAPEDAVMMSNPVAALIAKADPEAVFIACLPSTPLARIRLLCRRLHEQAPQVPVVIGRWGEEPNGAAASEDTGYRSPTLRDTVNYLRQLGFATPPARVAPTEGA